MKVRRIDLIAQGQPAPFGLRRMIRNAIAPLTKRRRRAWTRGRFMKTTLSDQLGTRARSSKIIAIGRWSRRTALADGGIVVIDCTVPRPWQGLAVKMDHHAAHGVVKAPIPLPASGWLYTLVVMILLYYVRNPRPSVIRRLHPPPGWAENMSAFYLYWSCRVAGETSLESREKEKIEIFNHYSLGLLLY